MTVRSLWWMSAGVMAAALSMNQGLADGLWLLGVIGALTAVSKAWWMDVQRCRVDD